MTKVLLSLVLVWGTQALAQSNDIYKDLFNAVDRNQLVTYLKNLSGVNPVTVDGQTFSISERYTSQGKAHFRSYFTNVLKSFNIPYQEMAYATKHSHLETDGHDVEAILPGRSADSVVIIVHQDSIGPKGDEAGNPGVDDDMTGMAMMLETARLLSKVRNQLNYTVRFVAADFEEWATPGLEGARSYASYIKQLASQKGFKIVASIDDEQSGWSGASNSTVDLFDCTYNPFLPRSKDLGALFTDTAQKYSGLAVKSACMGPNSDFYAMLEIGVPSVVFSEHNPFANPHFDGRGDDTFDRIDQDYFYRISQVGITFAGRVVGISSQVSLPLTLK